MKSLTEKALSLVLCVAFMSVINAQANYGELIFSDEFDTFDLAKWKHDLTLSGGGNWEFQLYHNNRTNSYVRDGALFIKPTLTADRIGDANLRNGFTMVARYHSY